MMILFVTAGLLLILILAAVVASVFRGFFYARFIRQQSLDLQNLRHEFTTRLLALEKLSYEASPGAEEIIYDGREGIQENDFTGSGARAWNYVAHRFDEGTGDGSHQIHDKLITVNRTNTAGRYELYVNRFVFDDTRYEKIPASSAQLYRKFCLRCEVKKGTASHVLRFVFKGETSKEVLDEKDCVVFNPDWQPVEAFFTVSASEECLFRIDDLSVMAAPSSIQIRNLVLVEKK